MNSEKRHELQQNVLANYLGEVLKKIEPHTKTIAFLFAAVVLALVAVAMYVNSKTMARSDATLELLQNASGGDAEALASVGDRYPNTIAGTMARLFEADTNLGTGVTALFSDREEGVAKIEDAIKAYKNVVASAADPMLVSRANLGLGRAYESLGQTKEAITAYEAAASKSLSDAVADAAKQRITMLQKAETQEFLTWFAKQDFKPADPATPPSFPDGQALPDLPDLDLPEVESMNVPDELKSSESDQSKPAPGEMNLPSDEEVAKTDAKPVESAATELSMPAQQDAPSAPEAPAAEPAVPATEAETPQPPAKPAADSAGTSSAEQSASEFVGDNPAVRVTDENK